MWSHDKILQNLRHLALNKQPDSIPNQGAFLDNFGANQVWKLVAMRFPVGNLVSP